MLIFGAHNKEHPLATTTKAPSLGPGVPVAAAAGGLETPRRGESATKESPESGMGLGEPGLNSPGSGRSASWKSASPGSPGSLRLRIMSDFVPGNMNLEQYESKLRRMASATWERAQTVEDSSRHG